MSSATCENITPDAFQTKKVCLIDLWNQHNGLQAAAIGTINPGELARHVFGDTMESAQLFLYLFRRFGPPTDPIDDYKEACAYTLTTPSPDVFLRVSIKGYDSTSLHFAYAITRSLGESICTEECTIVSAWHKEYTAWREANGIVLPYDPPYPHDPTHKALEEYSALQAQIKKKYDDAFCQYCKTHPGKEDELYHCCGPIKAATNAALLATLHDLKRPTYIRDVYFTPAGRIRDDQINSPEGQPTAEYHTPPTQESAP